MESSDLDRVIGIFLTETAENLASAEEELIELESRPNDSGLVDAVFRTIHTIKGNAYGVGFEAIAEFAHSMEERLEKVRSRQLRIDQSLVSLLLRAVDCLRELTADPGNATLSSAHRAVMGQLDGSTTNSRLDQAATPSDARAAMFGNRGEAAGDNADRTLPPPVAVPEVEMPMSSSAAAGPGDGPIVVPEGNPETDPLDVIFKAIESSTTDQDDLLEAAFRVSGQFSDSPSEASSIDPTDKEASLIDPADMDAVPESGEDQTAPHEVHDDEEPDSSTNTTTEPTASQQGDLRRDSDQDEAGEAATPTHQEDHEPTTAPQMPEGMLLFEDAGEDDDFDASALYANLPESNSAESADWEESESASDFVEIHDPTAPEVDPHAQRASGDASYMRTQGANETIRVTRGKLDRLLNLVSELTISRGKLGQLFDDPTSTRSSFVDAHRESSGLHLDLQDQVMRIRMVPIGPTFRQMTRTVREAAIESHKKVRLSIQGGEVEIDNAIIDHIRDPLTHMIRNAVGHGIETPTERAEVGKDESGTVTLHALQEGGSIVIRVSDDGRGIVPEEIISAAIDQGLLPYGTPLDDPAWRTVIFEPGLSTAGRVSELSGRGVGMNVVKERVERLRGSIELESTPGQGTEWTMRVPMRVAIVDGLSVDVAGDLFVFPLDSVVECVEVPADLKIVTGGQGVMRLRDEPLSFVRLRDLLHIRGGTPHKEHMVVVQHGSNRAGFVVDGLHGESQNVIRPLNELIRGSAGLAGTTVTGGGEIGFILNMADLISLMKEAA